jgi:hypothetical protein
MRKSFSGFLFFSGTLKGKVYYAGSARSVDPAVTLAAAGTHCLLAHIQSKQLHIAFEENLHLPTLKKRMQALLLKRSG